MTALSMKAATAWTNWQLCWQNVWQRSTDAQEELEALRILYDRLVAKITPCWTIWQNDSGSGWSRPVPINFNAGGLTNDTEQIAIVALLIAQSLINIRHLVDATVRRMVAQRRGCAMAPLLYWKRYATLRDPNTGRYVKKDKRNG